MAGGRTLKSLLSRRRRTGDEEEDEDGPVVVEDSLSEGSVLSEPDDDEDGDEVRGAQSGVVRPGAERQEEGANGTPTKPGKKLKKKAGKKGKEGAEVSAPQQQTSFQTMADTEAMMNGLKINDQDHTQDEVVDFESMGQNGKHDAIASSGTNGHVTTAAERQRREHEEYRRKRDSDPAFIPIRGNFFMHDTRGQPNGQVPPTRGAWQGRGRGRGGATVGGPFSPANTMALAERAAEQPWKHDLHDSINEEPSAAVQTYASAAARSNGPAQDQIESARLFPKVTAPAESRPQASPFDSVKVINNMRIRVFIPETGIKEPITFPETPKKEYVKMPQHRPPLRRDKPVRIFLKGHPQRSIFPSAERSFVFIPRQFRPNQRGYHHNNYQRSVGGYGYSSRRTSMYGGSVYSNSVAPSRRSSLAGINREHAFSPVGSLVGMPHSRPVVRMPQQFSASSTPIGPLSGHHTPTNLPQIHTYPLPQQPQSFGTPASTVHQPRPQKAISVSGIESPAILQQAPVEPQPFQNQLPAHMIEQAGFPQQLPPPYFSPREQYAYPPPQPQTGTPLSGIPEQAVHAPSFQPPAYGQPPYYPAYPTHQQNFYYSPPGANGYPQMPPMYMMPPPQGYMVPPPQPPPMPPGPHQPLTAPRSESTSGEQEQQAPQSGMVAHESNGMVFYVPASEARHSAEHYQPAESFVPSYAMPGLPPPTPAPENAMAYYYAPPPPPQAPQMPHPVGMEEVGTGVYYPAQQ